MNTQCKRIRHMIIKASLITLAIIIGNANGINAEAKSDYKSNIKDCATCNQKQNIFPLINNITETLAPLAGFGNCSVEAVRNYQEIGATPDEIQVICLNNQTK